MPNESQEALVMEPDFDAVEDWNWGSSAAKPSTSNESTWLTHKIQDLEPMANEWK